MRCIDTLSMQFGVSSSISGVDESKDIFVIAESYFENETVCNECLLVFTAQVTIVQIKL